ncbi:MAG TPA: hypothetical protein PLP34_04875, partial [Chitinophagaceae bacterium]|nr:hypothetical protein [Chitinophagaceae bacterium]
MPRIVLKRILKILLWIFFSLLTLMVLGVFLLSTESVQNILCQKTAAYLSKQLGTRIEVKHLRLSFFNKLNIEGVYVEDSRKDTLAYIGRLQVHTPELISLWWKGQKPEIRRLELEDAYIRLNRNKDSVWNYDFLNGSSTSTPSNRQPKTDTTNDKQGTDLPIHLKELVLRRVRFAMDDGWRGEDIDFAVQELSLHSDFSQFKNKKIHIPSLQIQGADILVREYDGNKPEDLSPDDTTSWGTPFNPAHWSVTASSLGITNSNFRYWNGNEKPLAGHFDEDKIEVSGIDLHLEQTRIQDDTLFSTLQSLKARERCGLEIKHMQAGIALSQVKAVLNNLNLETGHSVLKDRYEMHYRNFHDFNQYINKVRMVANLQNSQISTLDIGYFADILNEYPIAVNVTGYFEGTVDRLSGTRMDVQTLHTRFKGNARVTGLPDIEQTRMEVADIELSTSGKDLNALIPQTRTPAIAWNELTVLEYKGMYRGAIDTFYTKGNLVTSLGNASLDMNMNFRERVPRYAGHLETQEFQIGRFVHQQDIGAISMKGQIDGSGFSLNDLNTRVNAQIASFAFGKKEYHDLTINGLVEKKTFDGIFISKDPGLTFNFNGKVNLNGRVPEYNMNARFIAVDLQKAGITPQPMMASAFATLNFSGNTLDEFTGEASLRNLILQTSNQKFFLDSMQLTSVQEGEQKNLSLRSPLADASLQGRFTLSNLSQAVQVYLSHYLPQYIKLPTEFSNQELKYSVQLKNCDSILNLFYPDLHGLSGTYLSGE